MNKRETKKFEAAVKEARFLIKSGAESDKRDAVVKALNVHFGKASAAHIDAALPYLLDLNKSS